MNLIHGFTRPETLALTKTTSNQLQYLERTSLVVPTRLSKSKKPTVIYTWDQVLEIRAIRNLRQEVSLQTIRRIIEFLHQHGFDNSLRDKQLVVIDEEVFFIRSDWQDFADNMPASVKAVNTSGQNVGQYMLLVLPPLVRLVNEIWENAKHSEVVDFDSFRQRAKAEPGQSA